MPIQPILKPGSLKDPSVASLFSTKDPELRFSDLREIGHGSFGAVYFALDKETSENVAIKKMGFSGKQAAERWSDIIKEVGFLKKIRHDNIVEYKACYLKEQTCWLVMEYCIGSAADIVEVHKGPIFEQEIAAICQQALTGLSYIHEIKRIHRDVKAGNILLTDTGVVKLADLGSVSSSSPAQSFVGTPYWMAPEVILAMDEGHYDQRADIWSFGITCIELAERKPPFFNMNTMSALYHIAQNEPPKLQTKLVTGEAAPWSEKFISFVDQCLRKDPEQRLSTRACLNHSFVTDAPSPSIILELIRRTKRVVKELDNFQYRKMRKLMYLDEQQLGTNAVVTMDAISVDSHEGVIEDENASVHSDALHAETCSSISETSGHSSRLSSKRNNRPPLSNVVSKLQETEESNEAATDEKTRTTDSGIRTTVIKEEAINTLRRNKFSTLRTTKLISREVEAHRTENNIYEQMSGYKRLRQAHHKEVQQLDERIKVESDQLKNKLEKEYDHASLKQHNLPRSQYESMLKAAKNEFVLQKTTAETRFREELNARLNEEVFNLRKNQLISYHDLENKLLHEELNTCARQIETLHSLLRRHHSMTRQQEQSHLEEVEKLKRRHITIQHESELNNQNDYTRRTLDDLKKTHALQSKQQPRELKAKEQQIRKQCRQTCKTQARQFKAYQAQLIQSVPREEQKELINKLKAEQHRKILELGNQYEITIQKMMLDQTVKLETWQEDELKHVSEKLSNELNELRAYQSKQREIFENQCQRDRQSMEDKINHRRSMLEKRMADELAKFESEREDQLRMADELAKFESEREDQLRVMKERHLREMAAFDTSLSSSSTPSSTVNSQHTAFKTTHSQFSSNDSPSSSHSSFKSPM
uniref:Protein kinase domain-containing protein n=1 Tax=Panagrolaimus sp. PS1159 TaxID=55785 RepID=A0AC35G3F2_9BILA